MASRVVLSSVFGVSSLLAMGCGGGGAVADTGAATDAGVDASTADAPSPVDGGTDDAGGSDGSTCATTIDPLPVAMYVMVDQAGSMADPLPGGTSSRWEALRQGLTAYVGSADATTSIGLQYYGLPAASCPTSCVNDTDCGACGPCMMITPSVGVCLASSGDSCDAADYAAPDVEIGPAATVSSAVTTSLAAHGPSYAHATSAALQGAVDHAGAYAAAHPATDVLAVLVAGGDPVECETSLPAIDAIAAGGTSAGVRTAVVSLGATQSFVDGVAAAGATGAALVPGLSGSAAAQIQTAFETLGSAGCVLPAPSGVDPATLTLQLRDGTSTTPLPMRADFAACAAGDGIVVVGGAGRMILCPASCDAVRASATALVESVHGC